MHSWLREAVIDWILNRSVILIKKFCWPIFCGIKFSSNMIKHLSSHTFGLPQLNYLTDLFCLYLFWFSPKFSLLLLQPQCRRPDLRIPAQQWSCSLRSWGPTRFSSKACRQLFLRTSTFHNPISRNRLSMSWFFSIDATWLDFSYLRINKTVSHLKWAWPLALKLVSLSCQRNLMRRGINR